MRFILPRPLRWALVTLAALVLIGVGWFVLQVHPLGSPGVKVIVVVHPGDSMSAIADEMAAKGVIASPLAFRIDTLLFSAPTIRPGSYEIAQGSSFAVVKSVFGAGPNVLTVQVTPGLTLHEVALLVANDRGSAFANTFVIDAQRAATVNPYQPNGSLEGLIGVGTYVVTPSETPATLVQHMENAFYKEATSVGLSPTTTVEGLNAYEIVTAASIVEKEGYYARNMPNVARVIFNRLARGGPLQMDATVLYYLGLDGGTVTHAMLETKTPYNTYLSPGLTPTPICSVSSTALRAVLHAPPGPWLYFTVIDKSGTEAFAVTFAQQLANEKIAASRGVG
ncbi:MAG TPA: endolytic transglycosylase MltG [Acidimicrobiales bacterium]|nr:endolytic transglycosylase MltG [Acidimicrobiales bacterium]